MVRPDPTQRTWLLIGSGPSAPAGLEIARDDWQEATTITTNRGIFLVPVPDVYALFDATACDLFGPEAREAQDQGTHLVTLERSEKALKKRNLKHFDEFVPSACRGWEEFRISGLVCLEYAAKRADRVVLVGCEGYAQPDKPMALPCFYFDHTIAYDRVDRARQLWLKADHMLWNLNNHIIEPVTTAIVHKYPEVEFLIYGRPRYTIEAPNWRICSLPQEVRQ